jgi:hypothetical protein
MQRRERQRATAATAPAVRQRRRGPRARSVPRHQPPPRPVLNHAPRPAQSQPPPNPRPTPARHQPRQAAIGAAALGVVALCLAVARPWDAAPRAFARFDALPRPLFAAAVWTVWALEWVCDNMKPAPHRAAEVADAYVASQARRAIRGPGGGGREAGGGGSGGWTAAAAREGAPSPAAAPAGRPSPLPFPLPPLPQVFMALDELGIPDALRAAAGGPLTAAELAAAAAPGADPAWLERLLRAAAAFGFLKRGRRTARRGAAGAAAGAAAGSGKDPGGGAKEGAGGAGAEGGDAGAAEYSLNALSSVLCRGHPCGMADFVGLARDHFRPMAHLAEVGGSRGGGRRLAGGGCGWGGCQRRRGRRGAGEAGCAPLAPARGRGSGAPWGAMPGARPRRPRDPPPARAAAGRPQAHAAVPAVGPLPRRALLGAPRGRPFRRGDV